MSNEKPHSTEYQRRLRAYGSMAANAWAISSPTIIAALKAENPEPAPMPAPTVDPRIGRRRLLEATAYDAFEREDKLLAVQQSKEKFALGQKFAGRDRQSEIDTLRTAQATIDEGYAAKRAALRERIGKELEQVLMAAELDDFSMSKPLSPTPAPAPAPGAST
jgi:hypothetical protein